MDNTKIIRLCSFCYNSDTVGFLLFDINEFRPSRLAINIDPFSEPCTGCGNFIQWSNSIPLLLDVPVRNEL